MKREILFKGKLLHSKEWIEGNLIMMQNKKSFILPIEAFNSYNNNLIINSDNPFWVDENTIFQFINQTDKIGRKIFEGDYDEDGNCILWCDKCNGYEFAQMDVPTKEICISCQRCEGHFFFADHINDFKIVGNIAD